jgi:hypothetical protein
LRQRRERTLIDTDATTQPRNAMDAWRERHMIAERTKAALAAGKAEATEARMEAVRPAVVDTASMTVRAAADELTLRGIAGKVWHPTTVARARKRLGLTA